MEFLPTTLGTRRSASSFGRRGCGGRARRLRAGLLVAVSRARVAMEQWLRPEGGQIWQSGSVVAAFRKVMEAVSRQGEQQRPRGDAIVPDACGSRIAAGFDSLPTKAMKAAAGKCVSG